MYAEVVHTMQTGYKVHNQVPSKGEIIFKLATYCVPRLRNPSSCQPIAKWSTPRNLGPNLETDLPHFMCQVLIR